MPNYRIPNNANDDANGMWKMNAVQRAREGSEWPDPFVPALTRTQHYLRRATYGSYYPNGAIAEGTTSSFGGLPNNYLQYTHSGSAGYWVGNNDCDAIVITAGDASYSPAQLWEINGFTLGVSTSWSPQTGLGGYVYVGIFQGNSLLDADRLYLHLYSSFTIYGNYLGYRGGYMYEIPAIASTGDILPVLQPNTTYTLAVGMKYGYYQALYEIDSSYAITSDSFTTAQGRTFDYSFTDVSSFNGNSLYGFNTNNGTWIGGAAAGQLVGIGVKTH
jgi:hypothetical protein